MCYHISLSLSRDYLEERFQAAFAQPGLFSPVYHASGFSTPSHPVITDEDVRSIRVLRWGLVPFWVKDSDAARQIRVRTLNARAETIHKKPAFRHAISAKRCLVLVDGFYEWREHNNRRYPYYISLADDSAFALAGIWDTWTDEKSGATERTFSVITTDANPLLEKIHSARRRMPVILKRDDEKAYLDRNLDAAEIDAFLQPYHDKEMKAHTVSRLISTKGAKSNVPEVRAPFPYEGLGP